MGCSELKWDLHKHHIVDNPMCICGNSNETVFHYFFQCSNYDINRATLHAKILSLPSIKFDTKTLLYGNSLLSYHQNSFLHDAVSEYILNSKRFS